MSNISNSRLTNILSAMTRSEWRSFRPFIVSGVAGPIGKTVELYDYLSEAYPDFSGPIMDKKAVFSAIFSHNGYEDKKLRYALTDFYRQASSFLKFKSLEEHRHEGDYLLSTTLVNRNAGKAYQALYQADDNSMFADAEGSAEIFFHKYRKENVHLNYYSNRENRNIINPIGEVLRNLDLFFVTKKLQLLCEIINVRNVMSVHYDFVFQDSILALVEEGGFDTVPIVKIYYRIIMTLTHPEVTTHFEILKELLLAHESEFKKDELRDMYQYLMNYCIKKINQGEIDFVLTLSEIYKTILENKVIYSGTYLSQWDYKNMVVIGIRAGNKEWVKQFIENYKNELAPDQRENAYSYNMAYYSFSNSDYRNALTLLRQVEFTDVYYQLDMRAILLKCYFETDDQVAYLYHVAAYRIFLSRNKQISDYQRTIYRNMIKYTTRLMRASGNIPKIQLLLNEVNEVKQIADLNWLKKKILELLNNQQTLS